MNAYMRVVASTLLVAVTIVSCTNLREREMKGANRGFATPEAAADKARSDLLQALESKQTMSLGVETTRLRAAQVGNLARHVDIDFEKLATTDSVSSLSEIAGGDRGMIAPFVDGNAVVAVAEVTQTRGAWKPAILGNKQVTDDLNLIRTSSRDSTLTIYEVPNLNVTIYEAGDKYFLSFAEFNLRKGVPLSAFYHQLRDSAIQFQTRFGEELKKGKLVK